MKTLMILALALYLVTRLARMVKLFNRPEIDIIVAVYGREEPEN